MMAFVAALQGWFFARNRWWETALLLLICFTLFRPQFWMDMVYPPFDVVPAPSIAKVVDATPGGGALRFKIQTTDITGDDVVKAVRLKLGEGERANAWPRPASRSLRRRSR